MQGSTSLPASQPYVTQQLGAAQLIWDGLVNSAPGRFLLLALVLGFVTQGVKRITAIEGSAKKAFLMALPALLGMPFGVIPNFFAGVDRGIAVLLCAAAGVVSVYVFDLSSGIAYHLQVVALQKANREVDQFIGPPAPKP